VFFCRKTLFKCCHYLALTNSYLISKQVKTSSLTKLLARDAFVRTNRHAIAMMFVRLSVCLGRACIVHTVHFNADLSLWFGSPTFWAPWHRRCPPTPNHLFPVPPGREVGYGCAN